jgi:hypothetical protein
MPASTKARGRATASRARAMASKGRATASGTRPRSRRAKKTAVCLALGAVLAVCAVAGLVVGLTTGGGGPAPAPQPGISPDSMATAVTVDGQAAAVREFEYYLAQERANTFAYFLQHYNDSDSAAFWTTPYGGQTPQNYIKKAALADTVHAVAQQVLGRRYGVASFTSYAAFLKGLAAENARRAQDLAKHVPIYGPEQYTESDYFTYEQAQVGISLQSALVARGVIKLTNASLEKYYKEHQSDYAQLGAPSFAQAKGEVEQDYASTSYTALLNRFARSASVQVNQAVLAAIKIS